MKSSPKLSATSRISYPSQFASGNRLKRESVISLTSLPEWRVNWRRDAVEPARKTRLKSYVKRWVSWPRMSSIE